MKRKQSPRMDESTFETLFAKPIPITGTLSLQLRIEAKIPTVSEANTHEHWTKSRKRHKIQQMLIRAAWPKNAQISLPCYVCLERLSPRTLDSDNLATAFKFIRDQVADLIVPGKAKGQADADPRIEWIYRQRKTPGKAIAITIWGCPTNKNLV